VDPTRAVDARDSSAAPPIGGICLEVDAWDRRPVDPARAVDAWDSSAAPPIGGICLEVDAWDRRPVDPTRAVDARDSSAAPPIGRICLEVALAIDVWDGSAVAKGAAFELARVVVIRDGTIRDRMSC